MKSTPQCGDSRPRLSAGRSPAAAASRRGRSIVAKRFSAGYMGKMPNKSLRDG